MFLELLRIGSLVQVNEEKRVDDADTIFGINYS